MADLYANHRLRIVRKVIKYVNREFTPSSQIKVQTGQEVTPEEIIAQGKISGGFRSINLADILQVPPPEAKKYLQKAIGQKIFKGELLAFKDGTILQSRKVVTSPTDGVLENFDGSSGQLRMSFIPKTVNIPAAVFGIIGSIDKGGKIYIKTEVTEVFGLFGSGKTREGILHLIGRRGNLTRANQISKDHQGSVLVSGGLIYKEALAAAISFGVHGLISGGINAKDYVSLSGGELIFPRKVNTDVGVTVVACEGFGSIPLGQDIFDELDAYDGKFAIIDGNTATVILPSFDESCMIMIRKTAIQKSEFGVEPLNEPEAVKIGLGSNVRIVAHPFMGEQGKIVAIDNTSTLLPSGISTYQVTVETLTRKIQVAHSNIEII